MAIVFKNDGTLPLEALKTFGVSVKQDSDAIGYFGTGLKYALAVLLRNDCRITLITGGERYGFATRTADIRGKDFELITIGRLDYWEGTGCWTLIEREDLAFTTDLGRDWESWMGFREMYCNMIDEGGEAFESSEPPACFEPSLDATYFIIEGDEIEKCWQDKDSIILSSKPLQVGNWANAHSGDGKHIYYRNIRVADLNKPALFNYNLTSFCSLTEDRTLKFHFEATSKITKLILESNDPDFIKEAVCAPRGTYESDLNYCDSAGKASDTFLEQVGILRKEMKPMNHTASKLHMRVTAQDDTPTESIDLNKVEEKQLARAIAACEGMGLDIDRYSVVVTEFLGDGVLGMAKNKTILISKMSFDQGTKRLAGTILEEYLHLARDVHDETREMQNTLIDMLMSQYELTVGEPL